MWLMVSSLSLHSQHLLFCCVLSILALIWLVLSALSCTAKSTILQVLFFCWLLLGLVFWPRWGDYYYYNYYYCCYLLIRVFHISVSWWYFTGDWVTASPLKSPGLFSVFWRFSIMMLFGWSPLGRQHLHLPGPFIIL